jgi:hypothetical protein
MEGCSDRAVPNDLPFCVKSEIRVITDQEVSNPPARIYSYTYNSKKVYFIPQRCCDIPSILLDEDCNVICHPDGGITGGGDGRCRDFFDVRQDEKLVWEDKRK